MDEFSFIKGLAMKYLLIIILLASCVLVNKSANVEVDLKKESEQSVLKRTVQQDTTKLK